MELEGVHDRRRASTRRSRADSATGFLPVLVTSAPPLDGGDRSADDTPVLPKPYPETRYVEADDGVHIGYQVVGDGPYDVVLNDGWMSSVDADWELASYARWLSELARGARVIKFDRRGFGISDRPTDLDAMTLEKAMDDMRAVMDAAGSQRALVYGFEAGAAVGILFAASFPERTLGLVLGSPMVAFWRSDDFPWGEDDEATSRWDEMIRTKWGTREFWRFNFEDMGETADEDLDAWARWSRLCASPQAAIAIDQVERQTDIRALLPHVHVPTLVMRKAGDREGFWAQADWVAEQIPGARFVEVPGPGHFFAADDRLHFEEIGRFAASLREEEDELDRALATVVFTDIVGSTDHASELGDRAWRDLVEDHHRTVRSLLARYRGVEVDTAGDGFFATFDGPVRGVRCAQKIVEAVRPLGVEIRAGVHTGEVQAIDGKAGGLGVVIGARVGALAGASEVLVSQTVKDLVAGSGLSFEDRGLHTLKGVPDEWRVFALTT